MIVAVFEVLKVLAIRKVNLRRWPLLRRIHKPSILVQQRNTFRLLQGRQTFHIVKDRRIDLMVDEAELKRRAAAAKPAAEKPARGYARLYAQEILGADEGCDFGFLRPQ